MEATLSRLLPVNAGSMLRVREQSPSAPKPNCSNRQLCLGEHKEPAEALGAALQAEPFLPQTPFLFSPFSKSDLLCGPKALPVTTDPFVKDTPQAISPKKSFVFLSLSQGMLCRGTEHREKT